MAHADIPPNEEPRRRHGAPTFLRNGAGHVPLARDEKAPKGRPGIHELPDGTQLISPQDTGGTGLRRGDWVRAGDAPWRIFDMRMGRGSDRIVPLDGHPPVFLVLPAPTRAAMHHR